MLRTFPTLSEQAQAAQAALQAEFGVDPDAANCLFVPYRLVPLGAHVDHQGGSLLGRTIPAGTVLVYAPLDAPEVQLCSANFAGRVAFDIGAPVQADSWGRYAQAAALALGETHSLRRGIVAATHGALVGAGLSSSASVGLGYLRALTASNGIALSDAALVELDYRLEHTYLGLRNGVADQSVILYGAADCLTLVDARRRRSERIADPPGSAGSGWLIAYSGIPRELTTGGVFNERVAECRAAARWLDPAADTLGDIAPAEFASRAGDMPTTLRRRANHFYGEMVRVAEGAAAWRAGDLARFGRLMDASCHSSIHQYESGHEATIALHDIMSAAPGVYGSRFSGGGYGGCVVGLAEASQAAAAADTILAEYRRLFPAVAEQAAVYWAPNGGPA